MKDQPEIRLTQTVQKGGCAAKIPAVELRKILSRIQFPSPGKETLVDGSTFDDAAVTLINEEVALVQTLDFFTPIVDSPRCFGSIAAANALSDIYAMGGRPKTALAILAFPLSTLSDEIAVELLQGAADTLSESRTQLVGGHSIDDDTLKFGLSVAGYVHPQRLWTNAGARVGDVLMLTKALGTGTLTAALKRQEKTESDIKEALQSMKQLNNVIDLLDSSSFESIHAATDVTGFGLVGHSHQMAKASGVAFEIWAEKLPRFSNVFECFEKKFLTKAHRTNKEYTRDFVHWERENEFLDLLSCDPQTSGGLLLSVAAEDAERVLRLIQSEFPGAEKIGVVRESQRPGALVFV